MLLGGRRARRSFFLMISPNFPRSVDGPASRPSIPCFEPATGVPLGDVAQDDAAAAAAAVRVARAAQLGFSGSSLRQRKALLRAILDEVIQEQQALCSWSQRDSGKTQRDVWEQELWPLCSQLRHHAGALREQLGPVRQQRRGLWRAGLARRQRPHGVVALIVSSHEPLRNLILPAALALAAGNAVVIKAGAATAWSSEPFVQLLRRVLRREGHDPQLVQLLFGYAATSQALLGSGVDCALFIGNRSSARRVAQQAAAHGVALIERVDPSTSRIVRAGADLRAAAEMAVDAAFFQRGQLPGASERVLVHQTVAADFERAVVAVARERLARLARSQASELGAVTTPRQLRVIEEMLDAATADGAHLLLGGERRPARAGTHWAPTIVTKLNPGMALMQQPTRSPTVAICPVAGDVEAVAAIEQCRLGDSVVIHVAHRRDCRSLLRDLRAEHWTVHGKRAAVLERLLPRAASRQGVEFAHAHRLNLLQFGCSERSVEPSLLRLSQGPWRAGMALPTAALPAWLRLRQAPTFAARVHGLVDLTWALGVGLFSLPQRASLQPVATADSPRAQPLHYDGTD